MPFIFEQPNLDNPDENHLYFDPGDSRLITIFTDEKRLPDKSKVGTEIGSVHHIAFDVSSASFSQIIERVWKTGKDSSFRAQRPRVHGSNIFSRSIGAPY